MSPISMPSARLGRMHQPGRIIVENGYITDTLVESGYEPGDLVRHQLKIEVVGDPRQVQIEYTDPAALRERITASHNYDAEVLQRRNDELVKQREVMRNRAREAEEELEASRKKWRRKAYAKWLASQE